MRGFTRKTGVLGMCRVCGGQADPRSTLCCQICLDTYLLGTDAAYVRQAVFNRDGGICAACGLDTQKLRLTYMQAIPGEETKRLLRQLGFYFLKDKPVFWHADHVIPLKSKGEMTMENTQTLCVPCHKKKSKLDP